MKNNYLLESVDGAVIDKKIEEIIIKCDFTHATKSIYDIEERDLSDALEDLDTYNFLSSKKIVIIKNVFSNLNESEIDHLFGYIENSNSDNLLILTVKKIDNRLNIIKKIKKNNDIIILTLKANPSQYIKDSLKGYEVNHKVVSLLIEKCRDDITKMENECNKLKLYKKDSLKITEDDVENLVEKKLEDSNETLFSFIKYLLIRDKKNSIRTYQELLEYHIDNSSIIGLMSSQLKTIYQVKLLIDKKWGTNQIIEALSLKSSYQVNKMNEYGCCYSYQELGSLIHSVANLDYDIKSGKLDSKLALDLFILRL